MLALLIYRCKATQTIVYQAANDLGLTIGPPQTILVPISTTTDNPGIAAESSLGDAVPTETEFLQPTQDQSAPPVENDPPATTITVFQTQNIIPTGALSIPDVPPKTVIREVIVPQVLPKLKAGIAIGRYNIDQPVKTATETQSSLYPYDIASESFSIASSNLLFRANRACTRMSVSSSRDVGFGMMMVVFLLLL